MVSQNKIPYDKWARDCYSSTFQEIESPQTKALTGGKCCICGGTADITHHIYYTFRGEGDRPGVNLFPVCHKHHGEAHSKIHWRYASDDPITGRYQKPHYVQKLKQGLEKYRLRRSPLESLQFAGDNKRSLVVELPEINPKKLLLDKLTKRLSSNPTIGKKRKGVIINIPAFDELYFLFCLGFASCFMVLVLATLL